MAYNLESLVQILEQFLHPAEHEHHLLDPEKKPEIESLYEKACFLKEFFGNPSHRVQSLESLIRDAAHEAEDVLESNLVDRILSVRRGRSFTISPPSLQKVIEQLEEIKKMVDHIGNPISPAAAPDADSSRMSQSTQDQNPKNNLVGLSKDLLKLRARLVRQSPKLEIIPITGMGGIGKTTLARKVYDDPSIVSHFDTRAWITISQEYDVRAIVLGLLGCVIEEQLTEEMLKDKTEKLGLNLHQNLCGRRYLIVLDDIWTINAWDNTKIFFPEYNNGSRVLITTRDLNLASIISGSQSSHHEMNLLDADESWNLLREKVFAQEVCPPELENIGEEIAYNCRGLPLALHVIGGILSQGNRMQESWQKVAEDTVSSIVKANKDESFSNILSLSYNYLPNHLKPCFLYMGAFPEDYEIRASRLIRLCVADGFVKPIAGKTLEEAAQEYLNALVDRNLISVRNKRSNYAHAKIYSLHDLMRDLCVRKAREDKFLHIMPFQVVRDLLDDTPSLRRVSVHSSHEISALHASVEPMSHARSFLYVGLALHEIRSPVFLGLRMLKELDVMQIEFREFPEEILRLVNLRYLAFSCRKLVHCSMSGLRNLQTLIFQARSLAVDWPADTAHETFLIPQLRHMKFKGAALFYYERWRKFFVIQKNLQTLSGLAISELIDLKILDRTPNLKKLGVYCNKMIYQAINLTCLHKLETFKCNPCNFRWSFKPQIMSRFIFPQSLRRLIFRGCIIPVGYINRIAIELPNLEVLKLRKCTLESSNWELEDEEFCKLKLLVMENLDLVNWVADETHFPRLERLIIRNCSQLEEIPSGIGDINTLELIELRRCSLSAAVSLRKIHEEQIDVGNDALQVHSESNYL